MSSTGCLHSEQIIPEGFAELVFFFEELPEYTNGFGTVKSEIILSGQYDHSYFIETKGKFRLFSIVLQPFTVGTLFQTPAREFLNRSTDASLLENGSKLKTLHAMMSESASAEQQVALAEEYLLMHFDSFSSDSWLRVGDSIKYMSRNPHGLKIPELASRACLSRKQYERHFVNHAGISPASFLRIIRFQYALFLKEKAKTKNLTGLALAAGYYDQSHMVREFRQLTGFSPKTFFKQCDTMSDFYLNPE
jgi:AraC-like DNA-binding protein